MIDRLITYALNLSYEEIPDQVIAQAKRCFIDWVGAALGAYGEPVRSILMETIQELGGREQASIIGVPVKTSVYNAALVNGAMSHVLDYDDTHLAALLHPSVTVLPAVLAYGEWKGIDGKDFLLSYVIGVEFVTRISMAMGADHYDAGWHATATMGRFGAAAAISKLAGLKKKQFANALGLAGTQASGIRKVFGTMTKAFHPGKAAADGLLSALLARKGFTSTIDVLEGAKGLGALMSSAFDAQRGLNGLGREYHIMGVSLKPYASCLYTHPAIDGIIYLRNRHRITPDQVTAIHCRVSKFCFDAACLAEPRDGLEGKFSTYYCAAIALIEGKAGEDLFNSEKTKDPTIKEVMRLVSIEENQALSDREADVLINLGDGRSLHHNVTSPKGSPDHPLTNDDVEDKFRNIIKPIFAKESADHILEKLWNVENIVKVGEIPALLAVSGQP